MLDVRARLAERRNAALRSYLETSSLLPPELVRKSRSAAIAQIVTRAAPALPQEGLALVADAGLVLFAIDDLLDEGELSDAEVSLRVAQYTAAAEGWRAVDFDPIGRAIAALRARLLTQRGKLLVEEWARSLRRMLLAMHRERRDSEAWRARRTLPELATYLAVGRYSIGVEMVAWVAWIAMGDPALATSLASLRESERCYAIAVRLANDLRSSERERAEGKLNSLVIAGEAERASLQVRVAQALERGRAVSREAGVGESEPARFVDGFARGLVALYEHRDFHTEAARAQRA